MLETLEKVLKFVQSLQYRQQNDANTVVLVSLLQILNIFHFFFSFFFFIVDFEQINVSWDYASIFWKKEEKENVDFLNWPQWSSFKNSISSHLTLERSQRFNIERILYQAEKKLKKYFLQVRVLCSSRLLILINQKGLKTCLHVDCRRVSRNRTFMHFVKLCLSES